jgi:HK97 gp10 family phage protein
LLAQLPANAQAPIKEVLEESAEKIANSARRRAAKLHGGLKKAIQHQVDDDGLGATIGFGKEAFYGRFIELGTKKKPARPFLWPAFRAGRKRFYARLARRLKSLLGTMKI